MVMLKLYRTELNELFNLLKARNNSDALRELIINNSRIKKISKDTAFMMREFADIRIPRVNKDGD